MFNRTEPLSSTGDHESYNCRGLKNYTYHVLIFLLWLWFLYLEHLPQQYGRRFGPIEYHPLSPYEPHWPPLAALEGTFGKEGSLWEPHSGQATPPLSNREGHKHQNSFRPDLPTGVYKGLLDGAPKVRPATWARHLHVFSLFARHR